MSSSFFFFSTAHLNHAAVRRNTCVIVSPSACFIVHTTTSEELPLISGVSESPQHQHLLPAASLNAFLLRAVLCPSDSSSFSTSSFIIPMGISRFCSLTTPKALSFCAYENNLNESKNPRNPLTETRKWANRPKPLTIQQKAPLMFEVWFCFSLMTQTHSKGTLEVCKCVTYISYLLNVVLFQVDAQQDSENNQISEAKRCSADQGMRTKRGGINIHPRYVVVTV